MKNNTGHVRLYGWVAGVGSNWLAVATSGLEEDELRVWAAVVEQQSAEHAMASCESLVVGLNPGVSFVLEWRRDRAVEWRWWCDIATAWIAWRKGSN